MPTLQNNRKFLEAGLWTAGLVAVSVANPWALPLIDACLFEAIGLSFCPGAGLGHAVGFLARGEFQLSFQSHPFALVVVGILIHHIQSLFRSAFSPFQLHRSDVQSYQISS